MVRAGRSTGAQALLRSLAFVNWPKGRRILANIKRIDVDSQWHVVPEPLIKLSPGVIYYKITIQSKAVRDQRLLQ